MANRITAAWNTLVGSPKMQAGRTGDARTDFLNGYSLGNDFSSPYDSPLIAPESDPDTAKTVAAFYACTNLLCRMNAIMPLEIVNDEGEHPLEELENLWNKDRRAVLTGPELSMWRERSIVYYGNAYLRIVRDTRFGVPLTLQPIPARLVKIKIKDDASSIFTMENIYYEIQTGKGGFTVEPQDMLHFRSEETDSSGLCGLSILSGAARNTVDVAVATDRHARETFKQAPLGSGVILDKKSLLTGPQIDQMKEAWKQKIIGETNRGELDIFSGDFELHEFKFMAKDAQLLESREYSGQDICRMFGMDPGLIGYEKKGGIASESGSTYRERNRALVQNRITPNLNAYALEIDRKFLTENSGLTVRFDVSAATALDAKEQAEILAIQTNDSKYLTNNEARIRSGEAATEDPRDNSLHDDTEVPAPANETRAERRRRERNRNS